MNLLNLFLAVALGSIGGLVGSWLLLWRESITHRFSHFFVSFAAGVLLATAFLELLPESISGLVEPAKALAFALGGVLLFLVLEKTLLWYHCHDGACTTHGYRYLIIVGDTVHNFVDGLIMAVTYLTSPALGFLTALAVFSHEIPQEIGDASVLLHSGMSRRQVIWINFFSALAAFLGAAIVAFGARSIIVTAPHLTALIAGGFIYIAAADLLPEVHKDLKRPHIVLHLAILLFGVALTWGLGVLIAE